MLDILESIRVDNIRISNLQERIARLRSAMERMTSLLSSQPGKASKEKDRLAAQMAKLDELERELVERIIQLEDKLRWVEPLLDRLPPRQRVIVHMRLVEAMPWRLVSKRTHYSERHSRRLFRRAIEKMSHNVRF